MTTNYIFGSGRVGVTPSNIKVSLSPTTTAVINNTAVAPTVSAPQQVKPPTDISSMVATRNSAIDNFDAQINQMTAAKVAKQKQEQQAAQQAAAQSSVNTSPVIDTGQYSGPLSGSRAALVSRAASMVGTPYAWGGGGYGVKASLGPLNGPNNTQKVVGVDCSGLTSYVYSTLGIRLPRTSQQQLTTSGYKTNVKNLRAGDLVGWSSLGHVAMYDGNGGIIESTGGGVRRRPLSSYDTNRGVFGVHLSLPGD
jgi:cell wall-associated NlpC family hydrolase